MNEPRIASKMKYRPLVNTAPTSVSTPWSSAKSLACRRGTGGGARSVSIGGPTELLSSCINGRFLARLLA